MNHDNNNSSSELDSVISYVKDEFKNILAKRKELIQKLGEAYEKVVSNPESICEEIKTALHEEIAQKIVSARIIEKYCHDKWKRKTRPKNEKTSISHKQELMFVSIIQSARRNNQKLKIGLPS
jgi:glucose-6-phosphate-specific signal transduction histidine kinase